MFAINAAQDVLMFEDEAVAESKGCGKGVGRAGAVSGTVGTPVLLVDVADPDANAEEDDVEEGKITEEPTTAVAVSVAMFATALSVFCLRR